MASRALTKAKPSIGVLFNIFNALLVGIGMGILLFPLESYSNPEGGQVVSGNAVISTPSANIMQVKQTSDKAIIHWQSYNIQANEQVHYQQPSATSIALNRVNPQSGVSKIYGTITANGRVWLVNPAGIWFGPTAYVNVGGLLATTASISNEDFLAGRYRFIQNPEWQGAIINEGYIKTAEAGLVALVGSGVVNNGLIEANLGTVILAAGNEFTVNFSGNDMISFTVDKAILGPARDHNGAELRDGVLNTGTIIANGGRVHVTARTASDILDHTINIKGIAKVNSVAMKNGELILDGGSGNVKVTGKIYASGKNTGEKGGTVKVVAKKIEMSGEATIDVSGDKGAGTVLIGGNAYGVGPLLNADYVYMGRDAAIHADALNEGHGGTVVLWSDLVTQFYGTITARGGEKGGDGGWIETSSKDNLIALGKVIASAALGNAGAWLLDPFNVNITTVTANGAFSGGDPDVFTPTANSATIDVATINAALDAGTSVTINTGVSGGQAGNITVSSAILKSSGSTTPTLTLLPAGDVILNNSITADTGGINVVFNAGDDVTIGANITTRGGSFSNTSDVFTINASQTIATGGGAFSNSSNTVTWNGDVTTSGGSFSSTTQNVTTFAGTLDAGSGTITFNVNADGAGNNNFSMSTGSSMITTNNSSNAILIAVNTASGGGGTAVLRDITTGSSGTLTVTTDTGSNVTGGAITTPTGTLNIGSLVMSTPSSITLTGAISAAGTIALDANTDGAGGQDFTMASGSSINTTNASADAVKIRVNNIGTGNGTATVRSITTASGGTITVQTDRGGNTTGGDITNPTDTLDVGTGTITLTTPSETGMNIGTNGSPVQIIASNLNATSGSAGIFITNLGTTAIDLGTITSGGAFTLNSTSSNGITDSGTLTIAGTMTLVAGSAQNITLNSSGNNFATASMTSGNNVTLVDTDSLIIGTSTISGFFNVTTGGDITQSGSISVENDTTTINANSNNVTLATSSNDFNTVAITSANNVSLRDANVLNVGESNIGGTLLLTASGSGGGITQSGALTVSGTTTLVAGTSNNITFDHADNDFSTVAITSANQVDLRDSNALVLGDTTVSGTFDVTTSGAITQSDTLAITGVSTFDAGASNDIDLTTTSNNFSTVAIVNANNVSLFDTNAIVLGESTASGQLNVTAEGTISQSGVLTITGTPTFNIAANNSDVLLATENNNFQSTPVITGTARDVAIKNVAITAVVPTLPTGVRDLTLEFTNAGITFDALSISRNLTATANGAISQAGTIDISGIATLTAGSTNNITLDDTGNTFGTVLVVSANDVALQDSGSLQLGDSTVSGDYTVTAGGTITQNGALLITGNSTFDSGSSNITLSNTSNDFNTVSITNANNVTLYDSDAIDMGASTIDGTLSITASDTSGGITQSGALVVNGNTTLVAGTSNNIVLTNENNNFGNLGISSANNVSLRDSDALNLTASTVSGNLTIQTGDTLTDSGNIVVNGLNGLTATTIGGAVLNSASNEIGVISIANSGSGNITINTIVPLTVTSFSQSGGGTTQFTVSGTMSVANDVTIDSSNAALSITATDLNLNASGALNSGTSNMTITQNTASGSLGLGEATGTMSVSNSELSRMTANDIEFEAGTNGTITVDNVSSASTENLNSVTLNATAGTLGSITFTNHPSTFKALTANADDGITVNTDAALTTTTGNMSLNGDVGAAAGSNDNVVLYANLTSAGSMTLSAATNGIQLAAPISLEATAVTISSALNGAFNLTVDAGGGTTTFSSTVGSSTPIGSGVGAAITLLSTGTTTFANTVATSSGITAAGAVNFNNSVTMANADTGSNFSGLVTLNNASGYTFSGYDGFTFNGGLATNNGAMTVNSNDSAINIASLTLGSNLTLLSNSSAINITGTVSGSSATLTLQDNTGSSTGAVSFSSNVSLGSLITFAQPYTVSFAGNSHTFSNAVTFNNETTTFSGGGTFNFDSGVSILSSMINLAGTISSNNAAISIGSSGSDQLNLTGSSSLSSNGGDITFNGLIDGAVNLTLAAGAGNIVFNAAVGESTRLSQLLVQSVHHLTSSGVLQVTSYSQTAGTGTTDFQGVGLNATGNARVSTHNLQGSIDVSSLSIGLTIGDFIGTVGGKTSYSAIREFVLLNTIGPNRIFFDGIDIYLVLGGSVITESLVFPNSYMSAYSTLINQQHVNETTKVSGDCLNVGTNIEMCGNWEQ